MATRCPQGKHNGTIVCACWDEEPMATEEVRVSPLVCIDCEKEYGEVPERDFAAALPLIRKHSRRCPKRGVRLIRIWRLELYWLRGPIQ